MISDIYFFHIVFETLCVFDSYSTSQLRQASFQVLSSNTWVVVTILVSAGLGFTAFCRHKKMALNPSVGQIVEQKYASPTLQRKPWHCLCQSWIHCSCDSVTTSDTQTLESTCQSIPFEGQLPLVSRIRTLPWSLLSSRPDNCCASLANFSPLHVSFPHL